MTSTRLHFRPAAVERHSSMHMPLLESDFAGALIGIQGAAFAVGMVAVAAQGGTLELIGAIAVVALTLGAVGYVIASVLDFRPHKPWVMRALRAGLILAGIRISCFLWLVCGFKSLWGLLPLTLMIISFYPEADVLRSLSITMSQSPNGEPAFLGLILYSVLLLCTTLLQVGLFAGIVAAIKRVVRG